MIEFPNYEVFKMIGLTSTISKAEARKSMAVCLQ